jgi:hypothetical protein
MLIWAYHVIDDRVMKLKNGFKFEEEIDEYNFR